MDQFSADLLGGLGSVSDYTLATGGVGSPYIANQNPYDIADNGSLTASADPAGGTTTTSSLPSWLAQIQGLASSSASTIGTVANIVNGRPANSPANPASQTNAAGTVSVAGKSIWVWIVGAVVIIGGFLLLKRK